MNDVVTVTERSTNSTFSLDVLNSYRIEKNNHFINLLLCLKYRKMTIGTLKVLAKRDNLEKYQKDKSKDIL